MRILLLISLLFSFSVSAALLPKKENSDHRITVIKYSPDDVIRVRTKTGINSLIQFEKGETFLSGTSGIGIGDVNAWGMSVKGNNMFLKPTAKNPDTNLILVSDKGRTYSFDLVTSNYPHYIVKIKYEKPKTAKDYQPKIPCYDGIVNFRYGKWGDNDLAPAYMWDDGRFTCLKFPSHAEMPVVYQVGSDGTESLLNYSIKKDTIIIHGIAKEFRLRLGKQVLGLRSENTLSSGYNEKASSVNATRELNHD
jgi:type IV secretion system protein VirB9